MAHPKHPHPLAIRPSMFYRQVELQTKALPCRHSLFQTHRRILSTRYHIVCARSTISRRSTGPAVSLQGFHNSVRRLYVSAPTPKVPKRFVGPSISTREQAGHDVRSDTQENTHSAFPETLRTFSACATSRIVTSPLKVRLPSSLTRNSEPLGKSSSNYNDITAQRNRDWGKKR